MTRIQSGFSIASLAVLLAAGAARAAAVPAPLPVFALTAPDGSATGSSALSISGNWLLVYVRPNSSYGDVLLTELGKLGQTSPPVRTSQIIVIVGGVTAADAQGYLKRFPQLKSATWYADPAMAGLRALTLPGTPAVLGMNNTDRRWNLVGTLPDADVLRSILRSWAQKTD